MVFDKSAEGYFTPSLNGVDTESVIEGAIIQSDPMEVVGEAFKRLCSPDYTEMERNKIDGSTDISKVQEDTPLFVSNYRVTTVKFITTIEVKHFNLIFKLVYQKKNSIHYNNLLRFNLSRILSVSWTM